MKIGLALATVLLAACSGTAVSPEASASQDAAYISEATKVLGHPIGDPAKLIRLVREDCTLDDKTLALRGAVFQDMSQKPGAANVYLGTLAGLAIFCPDRVHVYTRT